MINLPFNRWTLTFLNKDFEDMYQSQLNNYRLKYFRVIEIIIMLLSFLYFIMYIIDGQQITIAIIFALTSAIIFLVLINRTKLEKKLPYYYILMYIISIGISLYISTQIKTKALYTLGFSSSTIAFIQFSFSHLRLRYILIFVVPSVQSYILDIFTEQDFQSTILLFISQILIAIYSHHNEYMFRQAFSHMIINQKMKQIIQEYVPNSFFAISLNIQNNSFQMEFQNEQSRNQFYIEETKTLIDMMRNTLVVQKGQMPTIIDLQNINIQRSGDLSLKRMINKRQTLEEYAFHKIKLNIQENSEISNEELDGIYYDQQQQLNKVLSIELKTLNYGKNFLLVIIKEEKVPQMVTKSEEQIKFLSKIIQFIANQLSSSHQQLYKTILSSKNQPDYQQFQLIKCLNLTIMNQFQNFYFFVNSNIINNQLASYKVVNIRYFVNNLDNYFQFMANYQKKRFCIYTNTDENIIKINTKFLSQIIINIFEQCLNLADQSSCIILNITSEMNLNPLNSEQEINDQRSIQELDFIKKVADESQDSPTKIELQKLIKFEFSFQTNKYIEIQPQSQLILNPQTFEDYHHNNNQDFILQYPITNFLLKKIGPYNSVQISQNLDCKQDNNFVISMFPSMMDLVQHVYQNKISFYIYTDQTQLTQSFIKYIQQKSFLNS